MMPLSLSWNGKIGPLEKNVHSVGPSSRMVQKMKKVAGVDLKAARFG